MQRLRTCRAYLSLAHPGWQLDQRLISASATSSCEPAVGEPLHRIISGLEESGKGRRVSKVAWKDSTFWHIVDVAEHPRSVTAAQHGATVPEEIAGDDGEDQASNDVQSAVEQIKAPKLPSIFAIKFVDGAPTTGRVMKLKQIFKKEWRLLPQQ